MSNEIISAIFVAILSSLTTLFAAYLVYRNQRKSVQAQAEESIVSSAEKISETVLKQLEYLSKVNCELREQKEKLEKAFDEAKKNYAEALVSIAKMESEYKLAMNDLIDQHSKLTEVLRALRLKSDEAILEIDRLKVVVADYERKTDS